MDKNGLKTVLIPPAVELLLNINQINSPWPDQIKTNSQLRLQAKARCDLAEQLDDLFSALPRADMDVLEAINHQLINVNDVAKMYERLSYFLEGEISNNRLLLYLPFELIPDNAWSFESEELVQALKRFSRVYLGKWQELLAHHDIRANFVDGDILEAELRVGPLEEVCKAAHLAPILVGKKLIDQLDILSMIEKSTDKILRNSLADAMMILADKGLLSVVDLDYMSKSSDAFLRNLAIIIKDDQTTPTQLIPSSVKSLHNRYWLFALWLEFIVASNVINRVYSKRLKEAPKPRADWEKQRDVDKLIKQYAKQIASGIITATLTKKDLSEFINSPGNQEMLLVAINGLRLAGEGLAITDFNLAKSLVRYFTSQLITLRQSKSSEIRDAVQILLSRWSHLKLLPSSLKTLLDSPSLSKRVNEDEQRKLSALIVAIESDCQLLEYLHPVVLVYGSKIKGYGQANSDFDLAVFVRSGVDFAVRQQLRQSLLKIFHLANLDGSVVDFWLQDNWQIQDFSDPDAYLGDNSVASILFTGVWYGQPQTIKELFSRLLVSYLQTKDLPMRQFLLSEIERHTLLYRLLHKGYARFFPEQGGIRTRNSSYIDADCSFWDSGYRQLATKLFITTVFLPEG
jgi:hypothetical protein